MSGVLSAARLFASIPLCAGACIAMGVASASPAPEPASAQAPIQAREIEVLARRYAFEPEEILIHEGETVVLVLRSLDRAHGFKLVDLNIREDIVPGRVTRVRLHADKAGLLHFSCDIFCGSGHEEMAGMIRVVPRRN